MRGSFLLITTRPGRERRAMEEVLDAILIEDPAAEGEPGKGHALIKLSRLRAEDAVRLIKRRTTSAVYRVVPLDVLIEEGDARTVAEIAVKLALEKLPKGVTFRVRCRRRGRAIIENSEQFERELGRRILEACRDKHVIVRLKDPDYVVVVEVIGNRAGVGIVPRGLLLRLPTRWDG